MSKNKPKPIAITHKNGNLWKVTLVCVITVGINVLFDQLMKLCGVPEWLNFIPSVLLMGVVNIGAMRVYFDLFENGRFDLRGIVHHFTSPMLYRDALIISAVCYVTGVPVTLVMENFTYTPGTSKPAAMLILTGIILMFAYLTANIFFILALQYRRNTPAAEAGESPLGTVRTVLRETGANILSVIGRTIVAYAVPVLIVGVAILPVYMLTLDYPDVQQVVMALVMIPIKALMDIRLLRVYYRIMEPDRLK